MDDRRDVPAERRAGPRQVVGEVPPDRDAEHAELLGDRLELGGRPLRDRKRFRAGTEFCDRRRCRQAAEQIQRRRLRLERGHELLDLVFGLPRGAGQNLVEPVLDEHITQLDERGDAEPAVAQVVGEHRKAREQSRRGRATERLALDVPEESPAEVERRPVPELEVKVSPLDLRQVDELLHHDGPLLAAQPVDPLGELAIRNCDEISHVELVHASL